MEIVTYVEAKFGLRIRHSKPSDPVSRALSDPMDVDSSIWHERIIKSARRLLQVRWRTFFQRVCNTHFSPRKVMFDLRLFVCLSCG